ENKNLKDKEKSIVSSLSNETNIVKVANIDKDMIVNPTSPTLIINSATPPRQRNGESQDSSPKNNGSPQVTQGVKLNERQENLNTSSQNNNAQTSVFSSPPLSPRVTRETLSSEHSNNSSVSQNSKSNFSRPASPPSFISS